MKKPINAWRAQRAPARGAPKGLPRVARTTLPPATRHLATLLLCLVLLAACRGSAAPAEQTAVTSNVDAIERYIVTAPDAVSVVDSSAVAALPTPPAVGDQGIALPEIDPHLLQGDIYTSGDPGLAVLTQQLFQRFVADGYPGHLYLENQGTHIGYEDFCGVHPDRPLADFAGGNRPLLQEELDICLRRGRVPIGFVIGMDAFVVVVHPTNDFVTDVNIAELADLFTAKRWSDVNPAWPQRKITRLMLNPANFPFAFFAEIVFAGNTQLLQTAPNMQFTQDQIEILEKLRDNPDAISFISYGSYLDNRDTLRLVQIEGMMPTPATLQHGDWPFTTPLLFYSTAELLQAKPQLSSFLTFYLTNLNTEIAAIGAFPVPGATLDRAKLNLLTGTGNVAWLDDLREAQASAQPTPLPSPSPTPMLVTQSITVTGNTTVTGVLTGTSQPTINATPTAGR